MRRFERVLRKNRNTREAVPTGGNCLILTPQRPIVDNTLRKHRKNRQGAAVVEFAVVAPIFILLVFGMIEFGRMVMVQQVITNASREGARLAVLDGTTKSEVLATVNNYLASSSITGATVAVDPDPPDNAAFGDPVTVTITIGFDQVSWLPAPMFLSGTNLSAETVMRRESVQ